MSTIITLTRGARAVVDEADYGWLSEYRWRLTSRGYAATGVDTILMHRMIAGANKGETVDHINRDQLDNRRANLRKCTQSQNIANGGGWKSRRSKYKGVSFHKASGLWRARITVNRHEVHLGLFSDEKDGAMAYDAAALKHFGEFARCNFRGGD